jgi:hypothetical protein
MQPAGIFGAASLFSMQLKSIPWSAKYFLFSSKICVSARANLTAIPSLSRPKIYVNRPARMVLPFNLVGRACSNLKCTSPFFMPNLLATASTTASVRRKEEFHPVRLKAVFCRSISFWALNDCKEPSGFSQSQIM